MGQFSSYRTTGHSSTRSPTALSSLNTAMSLYLRETTRQTGSTCSPTILAGPGLLVAQILGTTPDPHGHHTTGSWALKPTYGFSSARLARSNRNRLISHGDCRK